MTKQQKVDLYVVYRDKLVQNFSNLTTDFYKIAVDYSDFIPLVKNHKWAFAQGFTDKLQDYPISFVKFDDSLPDVNVDNDGAHFSKNTVYRLEKPAAWVTLNIWVKIPDVTNSWNTILSGPLSANEAENQILVINEHKFCTRSGEVAIDQTLQNDQWYMVTIVGNNGSYKFYLNGTYVGVISPAVSINVLEVLGADTSTNDDTVITGYNEKGEFVISDLAVYDWSLSANSINNLYSNGRTTA